MAAKAVNLLEKMYKNPEKLEPLADLITYALQLELICQNFVTHYERGEIDNVRSYSLIKEVLEHDQ